MRRLAGPTTSTNVLAYAPRRHRSRFNWLAFCVGAILPYLYAAFALGVIGAFTTKRSAFEAFYDFGPEIWIAIGAFPLLASFIQWRWKSRGFVTGVVSGVLAVPAVIVSAMIISGAP